MPDAPTSANVAMSVAASALKAQQSRMRVIAENIANSDSAAVTPRAAAAGAASAVEMLKGYKSVGA